MCVCVWCGVWCGVVWCGVVWCGVVWCGVVWCGVVWCGVVLCGVCVVVWCGVVLCGVCVCEYIIYACSIKYENMEIVLLALLIILMVTEQLSDFAKLLKLVLV